METGLMRIYRFNWPEDLKSKLAESIIVIIILAARE